MTRDEKQARFDELEEKIWTEQPITDDELQETTDLYYELSGDTRVDLTRGGAATVELVTFDGRTLEKFSA